MASVSSDELNVLTAAQADEACRIVDAIGFVSNDLGASSEAVKLNKLRSDLKALFNKINDSRYPVIG